MCRKTAQTLPTFAIEINEKKMNNEDRRPLIDFIFRITNDVLWNTFKKNEIGDVMLPFVVLRRLDCMLESTKGKVRSQYLDFKDKVNTDRLDPILKKATGGLQFYNTSQYDLRSLTQDPQNIELNFNNYINGFNEDVRAIMEYYQLEKVVGRLVKNRLLFQLVDAISGVDLHNNKVDNHDMGYIFEELIRIANEQSNETAGEHFTPRDVIQLMVEILFSTEKEVLKRPGTIRTIYDPTGGTGGMLNLGKQYVQAEINEEATIKIYGQEINEQSFAIAKSDLLISGEDADNFKHGNSFSEDQYPDRKFNYMLANPPYGVSWKKDQDFISNEALNPAGRFYAGLPRTTDGQFLFLQHMLSKMEPEGSRIAVVTNGSPLFTGDAGSGESEIRKWIIENDWLETIVALPKDLFYNTGINTFIWFLTNKKSKERKGKVQLIDARTFCVPEKRSFGNKRNKIDEANRKDILAMYKDFNSNSFSKILENSDFGYYQVTVEQPLLNKDGQPVPNPKILKQMNSSSFSTINLFKPDSKKRDKENIPLNEDPEEYFQREIRPNVPGAWIDYDKSRIGYEINFNKYFYEYKKIESLAHIKDEVEMLEVEISQLLQKVLSI